MLFNSLEYFIFYVVLFIVSWKLVKHHNIRIWLLLLASYYFYAKNNTWLILIIIASTQIDYIAALQIEKAVSQQLKKRWLMVSVITNLSILGFFKYFNFFADSVASMFSLIGYEATWVDLNIVLPVGISFYTFEVMSYSIDVYRGDIPAEKSWLRFSFFVTYFPKLVAGPIIRPHDFMPQLDKKPSLSVADIEFAILYITKGLIKKIVFGDWIGQFADAGFNHPEEQNLISALIATYCFTFQIYFDFSGYSDVAIGCSKLLGFYIPENFKQPYTSLNITDFWRRWHLSLSSWLRDYLYITLGGNRTKTKFGTHKNLMITMLLGGLWHGAAVHFIIWGGLQGIFLVIEKVTGLADLIKSKTLTKGKKVLAMFITFHVVAFSWIVFRSNDTQLWDFLKAFTILPDQLNIPVYYVLVFGIFIAGFASQYLQNKYNWYSWFMALNYKWKIPVYLAVVFLVLIFSMADTQPFIYFQF